MTKGVSLHPMTDSETTFTCRPGDAAPKPKSCPCRWTDQFLKLLHMSHVTSSLSDLESGVGLLSVSDLHHRHLSGQRDERRQTLAGVGQPAVDVQLRVHVVAVESSEPEDDGVSASVGQVGVLQVNGVQLPVSSDVTDQDWGGTGAVRNRFRMRKLVVLFVFFSEVNWASCSANKRLKVCHSQTQTDLKVLQVLQESETTLWIQSENVYVSELCYVWTDKEQKNSGSGRTKNSLLERRLRWLCRKSGFLRQRSYQCRTASFNSSERLS